MTLPRPRGRPRPRRRPDRWSDMLRGAAVAVLVLGMAVSALVARAWQETIVRQRDERLDRAASARRATIEGVIKEAAAAWQAVVRKTDLVARYGGEEFAILLPDCHLDDAMEIADRLRTAQPEGTCSLGLAQWDGREDVAALVARADRALYAAKEAGRDRIRADTAAPAPRPAARTPAS